MKYDGLNGKTVLLLGKTRSLNEDEFAALLKIQGIIVVYEWTAEIALVLEGRMMNPYEQAESARLYAMNAAPIVSIEPFEEWLCRSIESNRLLMSLKLSRNQERLADFIRNPYITDELFFKLLKLYDWKGEGLFDTDANRDVTAAIIGRFYTDTVRNHNVQYAMSGLAHLIERYGTTELIEAIGDLEPVKRGLRSGSETSLAGVFDAMALHPKTPKALLSPLMASRGALIARRVPLDVEAELLACNDDAIHAVMACNATLSDAAIAVLEPRYASVIAAHVRLERECFGRFYPHHAASLASNPHLDESMQRQLMEEGDAEVRSPLAANPATVPELLEELYGEGTYASELASNPATAQKILEALYESGEGDVLEALAANPSTPIDLLYQLSLERRYERFVKTNEAFGRHIQTHNIGWH